MDKVFNEGDEIRILPSPHLLPKFHNVTGRIQAWAHDNIYRVQCQDGTLTVLNAGEMELLTDATQEQPQ